MKEQFVTYEIALKLKELGFDEECFGYYTLMKDWMISTDPKYNTDPHFIGPNWCTENMKMRFMYVVNSFGDRTSVTKNSNFTKAIYNVAAPLWQQVIDWLFSKLDFYYPNIKIEVFSDDSGSWYQSEDNMNEYIDIKFNNKEQAVLGAIKLLEKTQKTKR